ncbi:Dihydroxyacetone synthase [Tulasnella sp. 427]|nr:Dihydroxyacetone synthase [Tulasnella sp. 427]
MKTIYSACYPGQEMCVKAHSWEPEDLWECVDTQKSSKNCGGCTQPMQHAQPLGRDCTIIPGQKSVSCVRGECVISKCQSGWQLSKDQGSCYELYDEGD